MQVENGRGKFNETELQSVFISTCHCFAVLSPGFDYILCFNFPLQNEPLMYFFFNLKYSKKLLMLLCALKLFGTSWLRVCRDEKKSLPLVPEDTIRYLSEVVIKGRQIHRRCCNWFYHRIPTISRCDHLWVLNCTLKWHRAKFSAWIRCQ